MLFDAYGRPTVALNAIQRAANAEPTQQEQTRPHSSSAQPPIPAVEEQTSYAQAQTNADREKTEREIRIAEIAKKRRGKRTKHSITFIVSILSALATVAIAGLTAAYVSYSGKQWRTMKTQLELSERPWVS